MNIKVIFIPVLLLAIQPSKILSDARADLDDLQTEAMVGGMAMVFDPSGQKYVSNESEVQPLLKDYVNTGLDGGYIPGKLTDDSVAVIEGYYPNANLRVEKVEGAEEEEKGDPSPALSASLADFHMMGHPLAGWTDITKERRQSLQDPGEDPYLRIRQAMYYTNKGGQESLSSKRILLFLIHGTFAHEGQGYYDVNNATYLAAMDYAATLGNSVELVSINWSGGNTEAARNKAVNYMKYIFKELYGKQDIFTQVNLLAHSHGGNIMNKMTRDSYFNHRIHNMFSIYTPIREELAVNLDAITGKLYHFYSTGDSVQYTGSYTIADFSTDWFGARKSYTFAGGRKATQITDDQSVSEQKALNYRVQFDGYSPSHTNILPIVLYLGDIIKTTKDHYSYQSDFDLNIDTKNKLIQLTIRHTYSKSAIDEASKAVKAQLKEAENYSKKEEDAYRQTYGDNIHDKSRLREVMQGTYDMLQGR